MKVNREVMRRLDVAEKKLGSTVQTKYVVRDFDGDYYGECGYDISQEQFDAWVKQQGMDFEVVILNYVMTGNPLIMGILNSLSGTEKKST